MENTNQNMEIHTFRAGSMQEALRRVRQELGPSACVLHTREVPMGRWLGWIPGMQRIEVTASNHVNVPSRFASPVDDSPPVKPAPESPGPETRLEFHREIRTQLSELQALVNDLHGRSEDSHRSDMSEAAFRLFTELLEADLGEKTARDLLNRVLARDPYLDLASTNEAKERLLRIVQEDFTIQGSIQITPGKRRLVALVGPTGVGKTTTIAKLAANFRLREKRRVGLITVDTYRIAAVEQLRTYAEIIDLPMKVVASPAEMRAAVDGMDDLDLVLLDTAGRSPRDDLHSRELATMLNVAKADEVHLVLSASASTSALLRAVEAHADVGPTALILTKLDEAAGLGGILPLLRKSNLPLSYFTDGQHVPDDIAPAHAQRLARRILGMSSTMAA